MIRSEHMAFAADDAIFFTRAYEHEVSDIYGAGGKLK